MIWYFLYPLRGTNRPPRLSDNHPIRRAFYRHGILTAHHWLAAMLASCAIAAALSYPTVFLSGHPTAGLTSKPHQVWTAARTIDSAENVAVDIEMRQIWVHGTYMRALEKDVLRSALQIQQILVGSENLTTIYPNLGHDLKSNSINWGFHSPLMYWNNSADAIAADEDVVKTINDRARSSSSLDVSLRPASVFAGKQFHGRKLVAADALVLTLMNRMEDGVGNKWQQKMHTLEDSACAQCTLYPPHGEISRSRLYEFTFTPVSMRENVVLTGAYTCMALYVLLSLRRLKAFHSRFGLVVTAITQMTMSILASFTICGVLKVNLATVPQNTYPFIVLVIGLENMFRLINAILAYPPTMATDLRIANALGDIGPLSVATAAQNLGILWLLAKVVSPGITAFCAFAAIATLVDTFFLLTFFVAVLNVDIRRLELQDTLSRSKEAAQRQKSPPPQRSWFDALLHGRLPFSTRMAGSVVTTTFILTLNYHFFERNDKRVTLRHLLSLFGSTTSGQIESDGFTPPPMNATLTPGEWIRMQDFDTAREVMRLVNPGAQSFVIRVFAPLVVVLSGADRSGLSPGSHAWNDALRAFAIHHFYPFAVVVVFAVTFVAVLMNFLLWNEGPEISDILHDRAEEDALSVVRIQTPHKMDIVKLAGSRKGHVTSIAFDRTIVVSLLDRNQGVYYSEILPPEISAALAWPIRNVAIDSSGEWLALHTGRDEIVFCNWRSRTFSETFPYPDDHPCLLFEFARLNASEKGKNFLVVLTSAGRVVTRAIDEASHAAAELSFVGMIGAALVPSGNDDRKLITFSEDYTMTCFTFKAGTWSIVASRQLLIEAPSGSAERSINVVPFYESGCDVLLVRVLNNLLVVDNQTHELLSHRILGTSGQLIPGRSQRCANCGSLAFRTLAFADEGDDLNDLSLSVLSSETEEAQGMCLREGSTQCGSLRNAIMRTHTLPQPGAWVALPSQTILGVRRRQQKKANNDQGTADQVRHRRAARRSALLDQHEYVWEAYSFSQDGELAAIDMPLSLPSGDGSQADEMSLYVTKAGPSAVIDGQTVAFAFGNAVQILKVAKTGQSLSRGDVQGLERHSSTSRKRGGPRKA